MMTVAHLLIIGFDVDVAAVVKVVRDHCLRFRTRPDDYSRAERAVLAEAVRWRRTDPRPPVPLGLLAALTEALQREAEIDEPEAVRLAQRCLTQSAALRSSAR